MFRNATLLIGKSTTAGAFWQVFGILLAALAIQFMLDGLAELGILDILAQ